MKVRFKLHWCVATVLFSIVCVMSAHTQQRPLSITISAPQNVIKAGNGVWIEVTITNTSNRELLVQERNPATDYEIDVRDDRGAAVPETDHGPKLREAPMIPMNSRNLGIHLQPNESTKENITLTDLYDLSHPGKYTMQVQRVLPKELGPGYVKSNVITITLALQAS